ncbi:class I SAM-dependent methyltransferase [Natronocalculus amylovorans]|uniref:Class I SAM-dependent methyltransferase n=1 Tax=Natronocalculus amylovorans TaxID=2917812 RepID=A0AAE3K9P3_9EURY|nr:class I SAM-dependent methyltransferase [Natronocalculus amylovorans]MCL9818291.1 class I SAM-dependent methyltransferase [Natronocalculus amylovorans]
MSKDPPDFSHELFTDVDLIERGLGEYRASKSLEIGCGYGRLTPWLARRSADHYAIDPEKELLDDARQLYPNVTFHNVLAQELPYEDSIFDLIVSFGVLTQVPNEQLDQVAGEIERVASNNRKLLIAEKIGAVEDTNRVYTRSISEYHSLFSSFDLVETIERPLDQDYWGEDFRYALMCFR